MHNYGLIINKQKISHSNAISLSLSSLCVAGRGLPIPADGKRDGTNYSEGGMSIAFFRTHCRIYF